MLTKLYLNLENKKPRNLLGLISLEAYLASAFSSGAFGSGNLPPADPAR